MNRLIWGDTSDMNRWQRAIAGTFSLLGLALAFLALLTYRPAPPMPELKPYLAQAQNYDVRIRRDHYGVPHICVSACNFDPLSGGIGV